jgi:hypothetical protein
MSWNNNYTIQDIRGADVLHEPSLAGIPQYSWANKVATAYNAQRTGNMFLPVPGNYELGECQIPRGGNQPRSVAVDIPEYLFGPNIGMDKNGRPGVGEVQKGRVVELAKDIRTSGVLGGASGLIDSALISTGNPIGYGLAASGVGSGIVSGAVSGAGYLGSKITGQRGFDFENYVPTGPGSGVRNTNRMK